MSKVGAVGTGMCLVFLALGGCSSKAGGLPAGTGGSGMGGSDGGTADGSGAGRSGAGGGGGARFATTFNGALNRPLDILFMIDNSPSMLPLQSKLIAQFPTFMNVLKSLPTGVGSQTGLPDIHVAVISSDTGPGKFDLPNLHCRFAGDAGHFQWMPRGSCTTPPLATGQFFLSASSNQAVKNYQGDISDAFACIAALGDQGCGFEGQLKSVRLALDPLNPSQENAGFVRGDAILAVILVTNEDDCSVPDDSDLADPAQTRMSDPLGPLWSWRCNEFGHLCNINGTLKSPPRAASNNLQGCVSNDTATGKLTHVQDEIAFLKSLKVDPQQLFVAAFTGPSTPYSVEMIQNPQEAEAHPNVVHSCVENSGEYADPAVRIQQYIEGFTNHGVLQTICANSFAPSLMLIATELAKLMGPVCIPNLVDSNPATPELDPDCTVVDYVNNQGTTTSTAVPACSANGAAAPCWSLVADTSRCPPGSLVPQVNRGGAQIPNGLTTTLSCAQCVPGVSVPGCR